MMLRMFAIDDVAAKIPAERQKPRLESRSIYVEVAVWDRLGEIANQLGRSRSALVAGILRDWQQDFDTPEGEKKSKKRSAE